MQDFTMDHHAIYSATLGLCYPWRIQAVMLSREEKRMDITVDFDRSLICPTCRKDRETCTGTTEIWHHVNFLNYATYLHARIPDFECPECTISTVERPWSREGSRFVQL
jgi:transposase